MGNSNKWQGLKLETPANYRIRVQGDLEATWSKAQRPIALTDQRGIVFLTSVPAWRYRATGPLSDADRSWLCVHQPYGDCRQVDSMPWQADRTPGEPGYDPEQH